VSEKKLSELERKIAVAKRAKHAMECRNNFLQFVKFTMPDPEDPEDMERSLFQDAKHHRAIAQVLEKSEKGHYPRLIVTLPPRHGKSELISRRFIPWLMGKDPYRSVIFATYNEDFAQDFGADCRSIMESPQYQQVFPRFGFRKGGASKSRIQTSNGGMAVFVGRGGSITGRGGDFVILDDPIKDSIEASSPTLREQLWDWFTRVLMTRLMTSSASIVIVQTRWHEDDLIGRLTDPTNPHFNETEASKWKIINLPAIAEDDDPLKRKPGDLLWPERFDLEFMEAQQRLDPRGFSALYQQRPSPEDGDLIRRENIHYYGGKDLPSDLRIYAASDHAVGIDKTRNDRTCLLIVGVDHRDDIYLLDCFWQRAPADKTVQAMLDLMRRWKPLIWWAERGHISKSIGPFLRKRMLEERVFCRIEEATPVNNKVQRAQSIIARIAMDKVIWPKSAHWSQASVDEVLKFPNARHDDFVDALAWIGLGLSLQVSPGGAIRGAMTPKPGTMAWIKWESKQQERLNEEKGAGW
jgi:predicted phage terminase large subunit-like protein